MINPYLITFTPRGNFFFGGSVSFSDEFYAESEKFPQPTTIIGALRAALLIGNNLLLQHKHGRFVPNDKKEEAARLTGKTRLNNFESEEASGFGIIKKISPVFLLKENDAFFTVPGDVAKRKGKFRITKFEKKEQNIFSCNCGIEANFIPETDLNPKDDTRFAFLGGKEFWKAYSKSSQGDEISGSGIIDLTKEKQRKKTDSTDSENTKPPENQRSPYIKHSQVGIGLEKRHISEGKFYVKNDFALEKGFSFAVICWLKEDNEKKENFTKTIVLGGDQSVFLLEKKEISDEMKKHPIISNLLTPQSDIQESDIHGSKKLVALSPLVLKEDSALFQNIDHAIVNGVSNVRMLNSIRFDKGKPSSPFVRDGKKILKSDAYRVIPAGSVFYLKKDAVVMAHDKGLPEKIGYNRLFVPSAARQ